jgi:hypothetical protein
MLFKIKMSQRSIIIRKKSHNKLMLKRLRFLQITTCPVQQLNFAVVCILIKLSHLKELLWIHISTLPEHLPRLLAGWLLAARHFCHDPQVGRIK